MPNSIYGCVGAVPLRRQKIDVESLSGFLPFLGSVDFFIALNHVEVIHYEKMAEGIDYGLYLHIVTL